MKRLVVGSNPTIFPTMEDVAQVVEQLKHPFRICSFNFLGAEPTR